MARTWWQRLQARLRASDLLPTPRPRRRLQEAPSARHAQVLLERTLPSAVKIGPTLAETAQDSHSLANSRIGDALSQLGLKIALDGDNGQGDGEPGTIGDSLRSIFDSLNVPDDFDFRSFKQSAREIKHANRQARREHRHEQNNGSSSNDSSNLLSQLQTTSRLPRHISPRHLF